MKSTNFICYHLIKWHEYISESVAQNRPNLPTPTVTPKTKFNVNIPIPLEHNIQLCKW